ncbi:YceD family protein [Roseovarius sp.]|uniref:YceD family protein n=1 Tax=Roseovarius sp. TaxID=1486281 RepID=UPI003A982B64
MAQHPQKTEVIRVADLSSRRPVTFDLTPNSAQSEAIASDLDLLALRKLRFRGTLTAEGRKDWLLQADLGATVTQPCVVTLEPVQTRIDEKVTRRFSPEAVLETADPGSEIEMPGDDTLEPLGAEIDIARVMIEALALALPPYPRREGAELGSLAVAEDGIAPMQDEETKPFAGLASLRDKLRNEDDA